MRFAYHNPLTAFPAAQVGSSRSRRRASPSPGKAPQQSERARDAQVDDESHHRDGHALPGVFEIVGRFAAGSLLHRGIAVVTAALGLVTRHASEDGFVASSAARR
jgi:hypothetical protein